MDEVLKLRLSASKSLIVANLAPQHSLDPLNQAIIQNLMKSKSETKLGLFNVATPNLATYYPNVTPDDLQPKESDFIYPVFRALSEVMVHASWNPISFSKPGVLKSSMEMLEGQVIYTNHEMIVGNELGVVKDVSWQNAYSSEAGKVPAGINSRLMVDGKKVPGIARSINMDPPAIHSVSVSLTFRWEQSHEKMSRDEFFRALGTYDKEGKLVHRVAAEILGYSEISFVGHGADPFAKKMGDDGKIIKAREAVRRNDIKNASQVFFSIDYGSEMTSSNEDTILNSSIHNYLPGSESLDDNNNQNENSDTMDRNYLMILAFSLGLEDIENLSDDDLKGKVKDETKKVAKLAKTSEQELTELKAKQITPEKEALISLGEKYKAEKVAEALSLAKLAGKSDTEESLKAKPIEELTSFSKLCQAELDSSNPVTCTKCGSTELSRKSSQGEGGQGGNNRKAELTREEAFQEAQKLAHKEQNRSVIKMYEEAE